MRLAFAVVIAVVTGLGSCGQGLRLPALSALLIPHRALALWRTGPRHMTTSSALQVYLKANCEPLESWFPH